MDLLVVDLIINMEVEFNDIFLNWEYYKCFILGVLLFVFKY